MKILIKNYTSHSHVFVLDRDQIVRNKLPIVQQTSINFCNYYCNYCVLNKRCLRNFKKTKAKFHPLLSNEKPEI